MATTNDSEMTEMDYIIEGMMLQDETLEDQTRELNELKNILQEKWAEHMNLVQRFEERKNHLLCLKNSIKLLIKKLHDSIGNSDLLHAQINNGQEVARNILAQDQKLLDDFITEKAKIEEDMEKMKSQFEENALAEGIAAISLKLQSTQEQEVQLENQLRRLREQKHTSEYTRLCILGVLEKEMGEVNDVDQIIESIVKKIADQEKNIQFLTAEIEKGTKLLNWTQ